jgi:hypothetical protein
LIQYTQTDEFLRGAVDRVKKNPAMQGGIAKPWEYISGGTMPGLVMTYFNRSEPFTSSERKIHSEEELLSFIIDHSKLEKNVLMHSPTHAFIFRADLLPEDISGSIQEMQSFWQTVPLKDEEWIALQLANRLPINEQSLFMHRWRQQSFGNSLEKFRISLLQALPRMIRDPFSFVDTFLHESLPLIEKDRAATIASKFVGRCESLFKDTTYYTPKDLREIIKAAWLSKSNSPLSSVDLDEEIATYLRSEGLAPPRPIIFADTNWSVGFFGLCIGPSGKLSFWRFHRTGMTGVPMESWFHLQKDGTWIILTKPEQYRKL